MSSRPVIDTLEDVERTIRVGRGERLNYIVPALTGSAEPRKRTIVLAGEGAQVRVQGLFLGHGDASLGLTLDIIHAAPQTRSHTLFKGALADRAQLKLDGVIHITKDGHGADAYLEERALLLSPDALANAIPSLEIEANDVRCKHAATAGPVDPELLFYLRSRGIDSPVAEVLLIEGFLASVLVELPDAWQKQTRAMLPQLSQAYA